MKLMSNENEMEQILEKITSSMVFADFANAHQTHLLLMQALDSLNAALGSAASISNKLILS